MSLAVVGVRWPNWWRLRASAAPVSRMYGAAPKRMNWRALEDEKERTARIPSEMMRPSGRNNVPRTRRKDTANILREVIPGFKDNAVANARESPWKR